VNQSTNQQIQKKKGLEKYCLHWDGHIAKMDIYYISQLYFFLCLLEWCVPWIKQSLVNSYPFLFFVLLTSGSSLGLELVGVALFSCLKATEVPSAGVHSRQISSV
jgi:hypothetical protein